MAGNIETFYFKTDLNSMISDLYTAVTGLATSAVSAAVTDLAYAVELDIGGEVLKITQSLVVDASAISAPPVVGAYITIATAERMIAGYSQSTDGISYTIDVADPTT